MEQGIQDNVLHEAIEKYGCYYLCLCKYAELISAMKFDISHITGYYNTLVKIGYMEADCFIVNPVAVLNRLANKNTVKDVRKTFEPPLRDIYLKYLKKPGHGHFVLVHDGKIWDSLTPDRPGAKDYKVDSYRVLI